MARIVYSALIESIKGSIGGTTFQQNAYGYTIKRKPNMVKPNSSLQNNRKILFSRAVRAWRDLTQAQRDAYDTWASTYPQYAKNNPESQLSGYAVFVKYHCLRFLIGKTVLLPTLDAPPATDTLVYAIINEEGVLQIDIDSTTDDDEWNILLFASRYFAQTQNFIGTATRYMAYDTNSDGSNDITDEYTALYGSIPSVGEFLAMDALLIADDCPKVLARDSDIYEVEEP